MPCRDRRRIRRPGPACVIAAVERLAGVVTGDQHARPGAAGDVEGAKVARNVTGLERQAAVTGADEAGACPSVEIVGHHRVDLNLLERRRPLIRVALRPVPAAIDGSEDTAVAAELRV